MDIARRDAADRGVENAEFVTADCSPKRNEGRGVLPVSDGFADLIVSRRGPTSWIPDAPRVLRPGGVMIHLAFTQPPESEWNRRLPESLRMVSAPETMPGVILERFLEPAELYARLAWERRAAVPAFDDVRDVISEIFDQQRNAGVSIRQRRYLWKATVPIGAS